jgi:hypothetical protein
VRYWIHVTRSVVVRPREVSTQCDILGRTMAIHSLGAQRAQ